MTEVLDYIYQYEGSQREIMLYFHNLLTVELELVAKIRFKIPFYYARSWVCYLNPKKTGQIEFAFVRGNELSNIQGILESKGRKQVYSIDFGSISDVPEREMKEIIQEALLLDEIKPYESKRKQKRSLK